MTSTVNHFNASIENVLPPLAKDGSATPTDIVSAIREQASRTPHATALVFQDQSLTYEKLILETDRIAAHLARYLRGDAENSGRQNAATENEGNQFVGICLDRSINAILAMLAVMRAGHAFVPLDPDYPADRLAMMAADAPLNCIITEPKYENLIDDVVSLSELEGLSLLQIERLSATQRDDETESIGDVNAAPVDSLTALSDQTIAYVMYTSGSTGRPKGVVIDHLALMTYCLADWSVYDLQSTDRTLQFSTLCFDIAIEEIFPPLIMGSTVVVRPIDRSESNNELSEIINQHDVTAVHLATAYWHAWVDLMIATKQTVPKSLRLMVVTGEKVSVEHFKRWQTICHHPVRWFNAYGPTEATVTATVFDPPADFDQPQMPIGKPLPGYEAYILDNQMRPVGDGETGQLFLAGPALSQGYLHRPDLTEKAFVAANIDGRSTRLYATGDLARWLDNGDIDFAGRIDHQIKLGSYRIEPGEIEATLNQHSSVSESLVGYDNHEGRKYLYVHVATASAEPEWQSLAFELASFLAEHLPAYMIPSRFVFLPSFPQTINGKIDRDALPDPSSGIVPRSSEIERATTHLQQTLCEIWKKVLNVPSIGIHDDFFLIGGSSLLVAQVITHLCQQIDVEIPVRDFFANPTIASLAQHIDALQGNSIGDEEGLTETADDLLQRQPDRLAVFFGQRQELYGMIYRARRDRRNQSVVLVSSLGHEYTRGHRNLQQLALRLSGDGFDVIRFDPFATGNSSGDPNDATIERYAEDISLAAHEIQNATGNTDWSCVALRWGAIAATRAFCNSSSRVAQPKLPNQMILWDPVPNGAECLQKGDEMHEEMLQNLSRFSTERQRDDFDECLGLLLPKKRRDSLTASALQQPAESISATVIWSRDNGNAFDPSWASQVTHNRDWILWDSTTHVSSAFSSPNCFDQITECLKRPCNSAPQHGEPGETTAKTHDGRRAVRFGTRNALTGVLQHPDSSTEDHGLSVIMINAGMLHHVGPMDLHVCLAQQLASQGVASLRFDLSGIGESLPTGQRHRSSLDRAASEIRQAIDCVREERPDDRIVLFGLCSGADDAVRAAIEDKRIDGIVCVDGLGFPTLPFKWRRIWAHYLPRLMRPDRWRRLIERLTTSDQKQLPTSTLTGGEDIREFPSHTEAARQLQSLLDRDACMSFIYTGGVPHYYNHAGQFKEMFPELADDSRVNTLYFPSIDHIATLRNDRQILCQAIVNQIQAMSHP